jgi:hypothetical protein
MAAIAKNNKPGMIGSINPTAPIARQMRMKRHAMTFAVTLSIGFACELMVRAC